MFSDSSAIGIVILKRFQLYYRIKQISKYPNVIMNPDLQSKRKEIQRHLKIKLYY